MNKLRLDKLMEQKGLVASRSQAESYIKLGLVKFNNQVVLKPGFLLTSKDATKIKLLFTQQYVSRGALKLESVVDAFKLSFKEKIVLDVGSSTGGFTDLALKKGARKVIAIEKGKDQLHPSLLNHKLIELHEKTDILKYNPSDRIDIVLIDLSFISIRAILPHINKIVNEKTSVIAMVKPQFEAINQDLKHKGVIKNNLIRRQILSEFEIWVKSYFVIENKMDSAISGTKGNIERFYQMRKA